MRGLGFGGSKDVPEREEKIRNAIIRYYDTVVAKEASLKMELLKKDQFQGCEDLLQVFVLSETGLKVETEERVVRRKRTRTEQRGQREREREREREKNVEGDGDLVILSSLPSCVCWGGVN